MPPGEDGSGTQTSEEQGSRGSGDEGGSGEGTQGEQGSQQGSSSSTGRKYTDEYVGQLRSEAADWRTKLREREKELETLQNRDLSEKEKIEKERDDLRTELEESKAREAEAMGSLREERLHIAFVEEVYKFDRALHDVEDAYTFIRKDYAETAKVVDENGEMKVLGVAEALKDLVEKRPYLVAAPNVPSGRKVAGQADSGNPEAKKAEYQQRFGALRTR